MSVAQLLLLASETKDPAARHAALSRVVDLVRGNPGLLFELQASQSPAVRDSLAAALTELASFDGGLLLAPCSAAAALLIRDEQPHVSTLALAAGAALLQRAVDSSGDATVRASAAALCSEGCALLARPSGDVGARMHAVKFAEKVARLLSSRQAELGGDAPGPLRELLRGAVGALATQLDAASLGALSGPVELVLVESCLTLCAAWPALAPDLLSPLLRRAAASSAQSEGPHAASVVHVLKSGFLVLLRSGTLGQGAPELLVSALENLGEQEAANSVLRQLDRSGAGKRDRAALERCDARAFPLRLVADSALRESDPAYDDGVFPAAKAGRSEEPSPAEDSETTPPQLLFQVLTALSGLVTGGDLATLHSFISQLSPAVLADVVLANMRHLPVAPPAHLFPGPEAGMPALLALLSGPVLSAPSPGAPNMPFVSGAPEAPHNEPPPAAPPAPAPPPPLVAQPFGLDTRADLRQGAAKRILHYDLQHMVSAAGGGSFRCAVLGRVGASADAAFGDALIAFALADYSGREGHSHLVQWLYCLYTQSQGLRSTAGAAGLAYEPALLASMRGILSQLPAQDRALPMLLVEAPFLPDSVFRLLEWVVGLADSDDGSEPTSIEQRTLGLIALRDVVLQRNAERAASLQLVLRCTVHPDDALRGKAVRMVVNQLHPLPYAAAEIEAFAVDRLESVPKLSAPDAAGEPATLEETVRRSSLYIALCTRAEALLPLLFSVAAACPACQQAAFQRNMAGLARTLGAQSTVLLGLVEAPPAGAEALAQQAFAALCDQVDTVLPAALVSAGRMAHAATQDVRFLLPCLHALQREELRALLPRIVALSTEEVLAAFHRLLQVPMGLAPVLSAAELVVALHSIDATRDGVPLKRIMDACSACFAPELRELIPPDSLAAALQQLVEAVPLPLLFMRTVIQTASSAPRLHGFVLDLLSTLVLKQVWQADAKLWEGVLRCAKQMVPRSFPVYLQLPAAQLRDALAKAPDLVGPLGSYARRADVVGNVPGETLAVFSDM